MYPNRRRPGFGGSPTGVGRVLWTRLAEPSEKSATLGEDLSRTLERGHVRAARSAPTDAAPPRQRVPRARHGSGSAGIAIIGLVPGSATLLTALFACALMVQAHQHAGAAGRPAPHAVQRRHRCRRGSSCRSSATSPMSSGSRTRGTSRCSSATRAARGRPAPATGCSSPASSPRARDRGGAARPVVLDPDVAPWRWYDGALASSCCRRPTAADAAPSRCCRRAPRSCWRASCSRHEGAPLGELFAFVSGLYFRGKLTYARRFAAPPEPDHPDRRLRRSRHHAERRPAEPRHAGRPPTLSARSRRPTCTSRQRGLSPSARARARARWPARSARTATSCCSAASPRRSTSTSCSTSSASGCVFPVDFVGRGDMSRGGLLLRQGRRGQRAGIRRRSPGRRTAHGRRSCRLAARLEPSRHGASRSIPRDQDNVVLQRRTGATCG